MKKVDEFLLPLKGVSTGTQSFKYHLDGAFFNGEDDKNDVTDSDVDVALTADYRADGRVELDFAFSGSISVPCDRCLDPMTIDIDTTYHLSVKEGKQLDDSTDNVLEVPAEMRSLDIAPAMRDTVLLCIPIMHTHADESQCNSDMLNTLRSLAATDGGSESAGDDNNDNESGMADPRWEALRKLTDN